MTWCRPLTPEDMEPADDEMVSEEAIERYIREVTGITDLLAITEDETWFTLISPVRLGGWCVTGELLIVTEEV